MSSTDKVLGSIGAMHTLLENFPMSILDKLNIKTYTSILDFMVDVLIACGVDVNKIIKHLLSKLYGLEAKVDDKIENIYQRIKDGSLEGLDQNEFMEKLEKTIKIIFMSLLSSLYTCSAIPVLPNKIFDGPNTDMFTPQKKKNDKDKNNPNSGITNTFKQDDTVLKLLQKDLFQPFLVPKSAIDLLNILDICPTSEDGHLYYDIEGGDKYYELVSDETLEYVSETVVAESDGEVEITELVEAPVYKNQVSMFITESDNMNDTGYDNFEEYILNLSEPLDTDVTVSIKYMDSDNVIKEEIVTIYNGETEATFTLPKPYEEIIFDDKGDDNEQTDM